MHWSHNSKIFVRRSSFREIHVIRKRHGPKKMRFNLREFFCEIKICVRQHLRARDCDVAGLDFFARACFALARSYVADLRQCVSFPFFWIFEIS